MSYPSKIMPTIIIILEQNGGEVRGTEELSLAVNSHKMHVIEFARRLARMGEITIRRSCGGRGNKTVYKRNRNSTGLARRRTTR